jgi:predicted peroxiredoxin
MFVIATRGPDQPNIAALPFVALKGAVESGEYPGERPTIFLMQEATYLAEKRIDLSEVKAVGLPPVADVVAFLKEHDLEVIVCTPCARARGIGEADLVEYARMGGAGDMAKGAKTHSATLTF